MTPVQEYIVGSSNLGTTIDLDKAIFTLKNALYEPEQFAALILRMTDPKVVVYLFASGKLVCSGSKNKEGYLPSTTTTTSYFCVECVPVYTVKFLISLLANKLQ